MTDLTPLNRAPATRDTHLSDAAYLYDDAHTYEERRLDPGVYPDSERGHALLVGTNQRSLTVVDLGGVVQVGGIDVNDPDHLSAFADHLRHVADRLRNRQGPAEVGTVPARQMPAVLADERDQQVPVSKGSDARPCPEHRTRPKSTSSTVELVDLLSLIGQRTA